MLNTCTNNLQIIVTGSQRGGTTATAVVIRSLGIAFPNGDDLHEDAMLFANMIDENWDEMKSTIASYNNAHMAWGWKYPSITRFPTKLAAALPLFSNPVIIHVWRDVFSVATHRMKHNQETSLNQELKRLQKELENQIASIEHCETVCPVLHVSYEKLITYPVEQVLRIQSFLKIQGDISNAVSYIKPGQYQSWPTK